MVEYVVIFLALFIIALVSYLLYDRYFRKEKRTESAVYVEALRDLLDGKQESAFTKLRQVVTEDSTNVDAYLRLGHILRENKRPDRALQVHKDLTLRGGLGEREKAEILRQLYFDYFDLEDFDMAQVALKEVISIDSRNRWAFAKLLELQQKNQKWDEAYDTAATLLKLESNKSKKPLAVFKYHMAEQLLKKREYHKARVLFKEALGLDPTYVPAYLAIGDSYCEEKRFEDAVNFWNKLIEAVPAQGHLVIDRLKRTLFDLGRFGDIVQICQNILGYSPKNVEARCCLAEFYEKKGDLDAAEELLAELVEDAPGDSRYVMELIRLYLDKADTKNVYDLLRRIERKREERSSRTGDELADTSAIGIQ